MFRLCNGIAVRIEGSNDNRRREKADCTSCSKVESSSFLTLNSTAIVYYNVVARNINITFILEKYHSFYKYDAIFLIISTHTHVYISSKSQNFVLFIKWDTFSIKTNIEWNSFSIKTSSNYFFKKPGQKIEIYWVQSFSFTFRLCERSEANSIWSKRSITGMAVTAGEHDKATATYHLVTLVHPRIYSL